MPSRASSPEKSPRASVAADCSSRPTLAGSTPQDDSCLSTEDRAIRQVWMDRTAAWAHRIVCSTEWGASQMRRFFPTSNNRLTVVRPVFRHPIPATPPSDSKQRPVFLYPANAWPHKNHDTLLVAYRLYRRSAGREAWDLVLTGHPDEHMKRVNARVRALGLERSVLCPGFLSFPDFARLWNRTGALVFPSLHEGFGLPVLEAMQSGIPIIAGKLGATMEVADGACLYTDIRSPRSLAHAMRRIQTDAPLREALVSKGRERAATFDLDREVKGLISAFDEAIADFRKTGVTWRWPCP